MIYILYFIKLHNKPTPISSFPKEKTEGLPWQCLGLRASTARGTGSIPGWGTKIPQAVCHGQEKKRERENRG